MQDVCHHWFYKETPLIAESHILNKTKVFPKVNQPEKANSFLFSWLFLWNLGLFRKPWFQK